MWPFFGMNTLVFLQMTWQFKCLCTFHTIIGPFCYDFSRFFLVTSLVALQCRVVAKRKITQRTLERIVFHHMSFQVINPQKCFIADVASYEILPDVNKLFVLNKLSLPIWFVCAISTRIHNSFMRGPLMSFQISFVLVNFPTIYTCVRHAHVMRLNVII